MQLNIFVIFMLCVNGFENWVPVLPDVKKKAIDQLCLFFIDFSVGMASNNIKSLSDFWYVIFSHRLSKKMILALMTRFECRFLITVLPILKSIYF